MNNAYVNFDEEIFKVLAGNASKYQWSQFEQRVRQIVNDQTMNVHTTC